jgi:hypothetical protein
LHERDSRKCNVQQWHGFNRAQRRLASDGAQFRVTQLRPGGPSGGQGVIEPTAPHPGERSTWAAGLAGTEGFSLALPPVGGGLTTSATSAGTGNTIAAREA